MIQVLILIICAAGIALLLNKTIENMLPAVVMAAILVVYGLALVGSYLRIENALRTGSVAVLAGALIVGIAALILYAAREKKSYGEAGKGEKKAFTEIFTAGIRNNILTAPFVIFVVTGILFSLLLANHRMMNWDDLSYWGIYTKDIFVLNRLPWNVENCTISYKDYSPIMQIMQYFFIFHKTSFPEGMLFQTNVCFIYLLMLPFLGRLQKTDSVVGKVVSVIMYIIFPHIFSTQFYFKLGVDVTMGILFGYGIFTLCDDEKWLLKIIKLAIVSSFLAVIKTSGILLSIFLVIFYLIYERREKKLWLAIRTAVNLIIPMGFYLSWKVWGIKTGNTGYLSDKVDSNVKSLAHLFPEYTGQVTLDYIKHIFTYPLTRADFGITAAGMIIVIALVFHFGRNKENTMLHVAMCVGLFAFCLGHLYMYLFVFDDWEAFGLLEFDRYINQYLAGIFYYYLFRIWDDGENAAGIIREKYKKFNNTSAGKLNPALIVCIVFVLLLPYSFIGQYLIPNNYELMYNEKVKPLRDSAEAEWTECGLNGLNLPMDEDHRVMVMGNGWLDEFQFFSYYMAPQPITVLENVPALNEGEVSGFCRDLIVAKGCEYVYVCRVAPDLYPGDFYEETRELTKDSTPLEAGALYYADRSGEEIYLVKQ